MGCIWHVGYLIPFGLFCVFSLIINHHFNRVNIWTAPNRDCFKFCCNSSRIYFDMVFQKLIKPSLKKQLLVGYIRCSKTGLYYSLLLVHLEIQFTTLCSNDSRLKILGSFHCDPFQPITTHQIYHRIQTKGRYYGRSLLRLLGIRALNWMGLPWSYPC